MTLPNSFGQLLRANHHALTAIRIHKSQTSFICLLPTALSLAFSLRYLGCFCAIYLSSFTAPPPLKVISYCCFQASITVSTTENVQELLTYPSSLSLIFSDAEEMQEKQRSKLHLQRNGTPPLPQKTVSWKFFLPPSILLAWQVNPCTRRLPSLSSASPLPPLLAPQ